MKITVRNLGIVHNACVDTAKPLILFCGPNSTGKTYLSNIIYAIFSGDFFRYPDKWEKDFGFFDSFDVSSEILENFINGEGKVIAAKLDSIFGISKETADTIFKDFSISLSLSQNQYRDFVKKTGFNFRMIKGETQLRFSKKPDSETVTITVGENSADDSKTAESEILPYGVVAMLRRMGHSNCMKARMLTVERNSINTFAKELALSRQELVDKIQLIDQPEQTMHVVKDSSLRYPLPIRDSLRIANDLENIQKHQLPYFEYAEHLEKELLHGAISINKFGSVEFCPTDSEDVKLPITLASSLVKTLAALVVYLKHIAVKGDLLLIDEPEMNLHPDNQIIIARVFAELINRGLRLVVSTHSDYIIRELNNLVMAHEVYKVKKLGGDKSPVCTDPQMLKKEDVGVYYFDAADPAKVEVRQLDVTETGFEVPSIDKTIETQNSVTDYLYDTLKFS